MRRKSVSLISLIWCCLVLAFAKNTFPQLQQISDSKVYSEGNFLVQDSILYVDAIVVKFKDRVIDLPRGVRYAARNDIDPNSFAMIGKIASFEQRAGSVRIVKQIPNAQWGDVVRQHRITGELVQIHDLSQLFTLRFSKPVPLDSTINEFIKLPEVEYAHEPISIVYYDTPSDPKFSEQWNLSVVKAAVAWDITHGSSTIKIGIVDTGTDQDHEDLVDKIAGGDGVEQDPDQNNGNRYHGTWVAGVAAAKTNNTKGVASLGWEIGLYTYGGYNDTGDESFAVEDINQATGDGVDVINMSWGTFRVATDEDIGPCQNEDKWIGVAKIPHHYPEIDDAITDAIAQGVICIASAGNKSPNLNVSPYDPACDPTLIPFENYPAQYPPDVIAVSGTQLINQVEQFNDDWNFGSFVDLTAPGKSIWTTNFGGSYVTLSGTSFSAPLVGALAALIRSVNTNLTVQQVRDIIVNTADKIDASRYPYNSNGWNSRLGYGRINAYQALLLAHAYSSKSVSSEATGSNSARHLVKESANNYHEVLESGITSGGSVLGEIFYRKSTNGGGSWNTPFRLSAGNEQNRYPCLAGRGSNLFAVWQRYDGSSHDIHFRKSTNSGGTWANASELAGNVGTNAPLPVIASPATNELMVVYRSGNNLKWNRSSDNGSTWPSNKAGTLSAGSGEALNSPSITATKAPSGSATTGLVYATKEIPNTSHIITKYYNDSNNTWSSATNISSSLPGYLSQRAHPSVSHSGDPAQNYVHAAWDAWDSQHNARVIIHRVGNPGIWNFGTQYYEFHYQTEDRPSIAGLAGDDAMMVFQNGATKYFYGRYDGASWNIQFPPQTGIHPSLASGSTNTKYLWTSGSSSPYTVNITSSTFSKTSTEDSLYTMLYHRSAAVVDTATGAWFDVRVKGMALRTNLEAKSDIAFAPFERSLVSNVATVFDGLASQNFLVPVDAESLTVNYSISGEKISKIKEAASPIIVELMIIESGGNITKLPILTVGTESFEKKEVSFSVPISKFAGKQITVKTTVSNISSSVNLVTSLGHIYQIIDGAAPGTQSLQSETATPASFSLQTFPNPFNPSTNIQFTLPADGLVTLRIYNLQGQLVRELLHEQRAAGANTVTWDGRNDRGRASASGIYFLRLESGKLAKVSRLTLVK